jgi:hypothetical protein
VNDGIHAKVRPDWPQVGSPLFCLKTAAAAMAKRENNVVVKQPSIHDFAGKLIFRDEVAAIDLFNWQAIPYSVADFARARILGAKEKHSRHDCSRNAGWQPDLHHHIQIPIR